MKKHLDKVEDIISAKEKEQEDAINKLNNSYYNLSDISKLLGCSRTTLYNNNQLLKRYIELSIEKANKSNPYIAYERIRESKQRLQEQVNLMAHRDVNLEKMRHENQMLVDRIKEIKKENENLQTKVGSLSAEIRKLKQGQIISKDKKDC